MTGDFFCGSFFWSLKKMSHQGSSTPLPLPGADFLLDPKTGEASEATHEIKRSRPAEDRRRSRFTPLKFSELAPSKDQPHLDEASRFRGSNTENFPADAWR